jgi:hypothetical protein
MSDYAPRKIWPVGTAFKSGDNGLALSFIGNPSRRTAFFEAFVGNSASLNYMVRGEGPTELVSEDDAFQKFQSISSCSHEFVRLSDDGRGRCSICKVSSNSALEDLRRCGHCESCSAIYSVEAHVIAGNPAEKPTWACEGCYFKHYAPLLIDPGNNAPGPYQTDRGPSELYWSNILLNTIMVVAFSKLQKNSSNSHLDLVLTNESPELRQTQLEGTTQRTDEMLMRISRDISPEVFKSAGKEWAQCFDFSAEAEASSALSVVGPAVDLMIRLSEHRYSGTDPHDDPTTDMLKRRLVSELFRSMTQVIQSYWSANPNSGTERERNHMPSELRGESLKDFWN